MSDFRNNVCFFNGKNLIPLAIVAVFVVIILAGIFTGCGKNRPEDDYSNGGTVQSEDSNAANNDTASIESSLDRFVLDEAEWPWLEDFTLKYPEYDYLISWFGDRKDSSCIERGIQLGIIRIIRQ